MEEIKETRKEVIILFCLLNFRQLEQKVLNYKYILEFIFKI